MSDYATLAGNTRTELRRLAGQISSGDDSELICWLVQGRLAGSHRPLRYHPDPAIGGRIPSIPYAARPLVAEWANRVIGLGMKSILCLATAEELSRYDELALHEDGLLGYLSKRGLAVAHLPLVDPAHLPSSASGSWKAELRRVQEDACVVFGNLMPPILVFCSGGQDRTPPVAAYVASHL